MLLNQLFEAITRTGKGNTAVVGWGRGMGHKGHMMLASSVITKAKEMGGDPYFVVSKTVGKDDPITPDEKLAIYKKVFPQSGHIFQPATDEMPDLTRVLTNLNKQGYVNAVVVVGADQVKAFQYLKNYNGKADKSGNVAFNFDTLDVISRQETGDPSAGDEGPRATPMRQVLQDPTKSDKEQFIAWRDAMSPEIGDDEVRDLMMKAKTRMAGFAKPKKEGVTENWGIEKFAIPLPIGQYLAVGSDEFAPPGNYKSAEDLHDEVFDLIDAGVEPDAATVNPRSLLATQDWLGNAGGDDPLFDEYPDRPVVYKKAGKLYILDGHHRTTRAWRAGRPIAVYLFSDRPQQDLDESAGTYREIEFVCANPDFCDATERTIVVANSPGEAAIKFKAETPEAYIKDIVAMRQGVAEGSYTTEKQILTRIRQIMYDRKLSGTESNAGELHRLKQQLKDMRSQQGVAEGNDDDVWGPQGNFAGDVPVNLGGAVSKRLDIDDIVSYFGEKATILAMSKDRTVSRINLKSGITQNVKTSDLKRVGRGVSEGVPQPGPSSGAPKQFGPDAKIETRQMTVKDIISSVPGVPYYNNVVDDWDAKDYSWGVTKKVIEYATYLKDHPESLAKLPPAIVLNGKFEDGAHRVSAIWLLQQRMDPKNPLWKNAKLNVQFVKQGVAEGLDNKVAKHNAAVAKLPGGQAHRSNHPDILKTAPKGYSFSVSHKLVPDEQGVAEATGDEKFDTMMKKVAKTPTQAQRNAERIRQKREREEETRKHFANGGGLGTSPADKLSIRKGVAEGSEEAEKYRAQLLKTAPRVMDFLAKAVKGWRPSEQEMLDAIDTAYTVMKHTGDVKQAGKAMVDELNTLHRMSQGQSGVAESEKQSKSREMDLDWHYKNIINTKGLGDKAKKDTTDIYNKLKKKKEQGVAEGGSNAMADTAKRLANKDDGKVAKLRAAGDKRREDELKSRNIAKKDKSSKDQWGNFKEEVVRREEFEEARMSAAAKLGKAWDQQQAKSAASRERAKELLNPKKQDDKEKEVKANEEKQRLDPKCWKGYRKQGTKMKGGVRVNNCVKIGEGWENIMTETVNKLFRGK